MKSRHLPFLLFAAGLGAAPAAAVEPDDLDLFLPSTLQDAFAGQPGEAEAQLGLRYDRRRGKDELRIFPQYQISPADGLLLNLSLPYTVGSGERANEGEAGIGFFYNLNREKGWLPAFAVAVEADTPVGPGDRGTQVQVTGIATRSIDAAAHRRIHVNASWSVRFAPSAEERHQPYRLVAGYSQLLSPQTAFILDYVRERQERGEHDSNVVELAFRHRLAERVTVGFGAGAGIGHDSPRYRLLFSVEADF
ncbi:hypothetical protein ACFQX4_14285 [Roseomonas sp. GCM10028921]